MGTRSASIIGGGGASPGAAAWSVVGPITAGRSASFGELILIDMTGVSGALTIDLPEVTSADLGKRVMVSIVSDAVGVGAAVNVIPFGDQLVGGPAGNPGTTLDTPFSYVVLVAASATWGYIVEAAG